MKIKNQKKLLCGGFLIAIGIGYLMYAGMQGSTMYYLTVEEFLAQQHSSGEGIRIAGIVAEDSIRRQEDVRDVEFAIRGASGNGRIAVSYHGSVPDTFVHGAQVILEGKYRQEEGIFQAVTLLTSCPSKYESTLE